LLRQRVLLAWFLVLTCAVGKAPLSEAQGKEEAGTVVSLSDIHLSQTLEDGYLLSRSAGKILRGLVVDLNQREDLDFVVVTGDLVCDPGSGDLEVVRDILDGLRKPYFVVPGNHDRLDRRAGPPEPQGGPKTIDVIFQGHGPQPGRMYWSQDPAPGLHLIGLDTTVPGGWAGKVDAQQLRWLEQDLESHRGTQTIVLTHHNLVEFHPWDNEGEWKSYVLSNAKAVRSLLERFSSVCVVISGHHHLSGARTLNGIHYITCPSTSSWPCRYSLFQIAGNGLTFSTKPIPSSSLIDIAWHNLLGFRHFRKRFPEGKAGEDEIFRAFMGPQQLLLPLSRCTSVHPLSTLSVP